MDNVERNEMANVLKELAAHWTHFKTGEMDIWLDRLMPWTAAEVQAVVRLFAMHDPRQTEAARKERPKLSDIIRCLPARAGVERPSSCPNWYCLNSLTFAGEIRITNPKEREYVIASLRNCPQNASLLERRTAIMKAMGIDPQELETQKGAA